MRSHRILGVCLALAGLALLIGQLALLYGRSDQQAIMVAIGLPGVGVLTFAGCASFGVGCLLATAPHATVRHMRRAADAIRRRKSI